MTKLLLIGFISLLTACASNGPKYSSAIIPIESSKLSDYWIKYKTKYGSTTYTFLGEDGTCRMLSDVAPEENTSFAMYSLIIDSHGKTHKWKYKSKSEGADVGLGMLNMLADKNILLSTNRYSPSSKNRLKVPVVVDIKKYIISCPEKSAI